MGRVRMAFALCFLLLLMAPAASGSQIYGDYLETRSADVYAGACFANAEVGLVGDQAILAWRIQKGTWEGVPLDGLSVVGIVKAKATLGDPFHSPYPAKSVLVVDERATSEQRRALQDLARSMAGELLSDVVRVESAPIALELGEQHGSVKLTVGTLARIETRSIGNNDHLCGNEETYYPPLTPLDHAMPVYALANEFTGEGLGVVWSLRDKRSAFVGTFAR
ncbi:MAG: DUF1326 domain-containing protein [Acidobacteria bacterium]|nr:DUF1326 domain-containing protein [Acidobacteriota bacterium]